MSDIQPVFMTAVEVRDVLKEIVGVLKEIEQTLSRTTEVLERLELHAERYVDGKR